MLLPRLLVSAALVATGLFALAPRAVACPGCGAPTGQTFTSEVAQADFILFGTLTNQKADPKDPGGSKGTTDIMIDVVVKDHPVVKDKKVFTIPRYVPPDPKPYKYLVFFNVVNGDVDPYRGVAVPVDSKLPEYVKGAIEVRQKDTVTRLRYFFDHLESNDMEIGADAYNEFAVSDYKDVQQLAPKLPAETLLKWLKDPNTRPSRYGLYGLLLGHATAKQAEYAKELRALLDDKSKKFSSGLSGMLMGYLLLDPKAANEYMRALAADPESEFLAKHAVLQAYRFVWEYRSDALSRKEVLDGMAVLMADPNVADMPIDDLRKWGAWEMTPEVLKYATVESHNKLPINRRAMLKFAIAASWADPKNMVAAEFVKAAREKDPDRVKLLEDLLKDEQKAPPKPPEPPKKR